MKKLMLTFLISLLILVCSAQRKYSKKNLIQLPILELNEYDLKAHKLKKNGERLAIYGTISGLIGIGVGSINNDNFSSSDGSDVLFGLAATMFVGGMAATLIGIPMFYTGLVRCTQIDEVRVIKDRAMRIEIEPSNIYSKQTHTNYSGITVRLFF